MDNSKVGTYTFMAEPYQLDFMGRLTIPMIGGYLLHAASSHAGARGFGYSDMTERHTAWVLSRLAIEQICEPDLSAPITVYTWIVEVGRIFTSRCFELVDGAGKTFAYARSIWAAIDMETRRPTRLDVEALSSYIASRPCPIEQPGKIASVEEETEGLPYTVRYSDLDINGHLNSIKYMEHLINLFDVEQFRSATIRRFEIAYLAEGKYGMELKLHNRKTADGLYEMAICHEGHALARAAIRWEKNDIEFSENEK